MSTEAPLDLQEIAKIHAIIAEMPIQTRSYYLSLVAHRADLDNSTNNDNLTLEELIREHGDVQAVMDIISKPYEVPTFIRSFEIQRVVLLSDPSVRMALLFEQVVNGKNDVDLKAISKASVSLLDESMRMRNSKVGTPGCIAFFLEPGEEIIRKEFGILSDIHSATNSVNTHKISIALNEDVLSCQHMYEFIATKSNLS